MPTVFITGANRGLGLEFTRQYAAEGWRVHACCRAPQDAAALQRLADQHDGQLTVHALDVANFTQLDDLAFDLRDESIDLLLNNAGIYPECDRLGLGMTDFDAWEQAFRVNAMAPLKLAEAFTRHVANSDMKKMAFITSKMGSIADNGSGGSYTYRSSKAALNAVVRSLSIDLAARGIAVALLHPGWVKTDMGGPNAWITAEQSISSMRRMIDQLTPASSGQFFAYDGQPVPW